MTITARLVPAAGVGACALVVGSLAGCRPPANAPAEAPSAPPGEVRLPPGSPQLAYLTVDSVTRRTERVVAVLPAQLVPDENHTVRVASPVNGRVRRVEVRSGDHVRPGQPLARIASSDVGQAQSDLLKAEAALAQATAALARSRDLYEHRVIALKDLQQAESEAAQARAERDRAAARVRLLGARSTELASDFVLRAPIGGEVIERGVAPGSEVRADNLQALFTISSLDTLWLVASVYQRDLALVRPGDQLVFTTDAAPGRRFTATVQYVSATLDPPTRTATIRATLPNPDHALRTQVFGDARLVVPDTDSAAVVPVDALVTHAGETVVWVEEGPRRFARRPVAVADDDGQTAAIARGLRAGERIVTRGSLLLEADASGGR